MGKPSFEEAVQFVREQRATKNLTLTSPMLLGFQIQAAEWNQGAWDEVIQIAQRLLRHRAPLPDVLAEWVADVLQEKRQRPPRRGRPVTNRARDAAVIDCIKLLTARGFKPTRNKATTERCSACDVVAEAFDMQYKRVEDIWVNRQGPPTEAELEWLGWNLFAGPGKTRK